MGMASYLREQHREVAEHREQNARDGIADREADPRNAAVDFLGCLAGRARVRPRAGDAAHQHGRIDLHEVIADGPGEDGRNRAGDEAGEEDEERDLAGQLRQQRGARR